MKNFLYLFSIITILFFYSNIAAEKSILTTQNALRPQLTFDTKKNQDRIVSALDNFLPLNEEAPNISEDKIPHRVVNEHIEELIEQKRLVEVSFGLNNKVAAKIVGTDEEATLSKELVEKLQSAKEKLDDYYRIFNEFTTDKRNIYDKVGELEKQFEDLYSIYAGFWTNNMHKDQEFINTRFLELIDKAKQTKINIALGTPYACETGRIVTQARRAKEGTPQAKLGYAYTIGEWTLDDMEVNQIVRCTLEEALHYGNKKPHGTIKKPEDFDKVIQHNETFQGKLEKIAKNSLVTHAPWQPLYKGTMVGKSPEMRKIFETFDEIRSSSKAPIIIVGKTGSGKSLLAKTLDRKYHYIGASELSDNEAIQNAIEKAGDGVLIIENFEAIPKPSKEGDTSNLQNILLTYLDKSKTGDIKCRIVITSTTQENLIPTLDRRLITITMPSLYNREDDSLLLAEYYIWKSCEQYKIPWVPLDEYIANEIKRLVKYRWDLIDEYGVSIFEEIMIERVIQKRARILKHGGFSRLPIGEDLTKPDYYNRYWRENLITIADFISAYADNTDNPLLDAIWIYIDSEVAGYKTKYLINPLSEKPIFCYDTPYFPELQVVADLAIAPESIYFGLHDEEAPNIAMGHLNQPTKYSRSCI